MGRNGNPVFRKGNTYYANFTVNGNRFRRSLKTDSRQVAETIAAKMKTDALLGNLNSNRPEHPLYNGSVARATGEPVDTEEVEIYSYEVNRVVLRVPWRRYPGILIQGDELSELGGQADRVSAWLLARFRSVDLDANDLEGVGALHSLTDELKSLLKHYAKVTRWR
jgi:hypothetical protein